MTKILQKWPTIAANKGKFNKPTQINNSHLSDRKTNRSLKGSTSACLSSTRSASIMLASPQSTWNPTEEQNIYQNSKFTTSLPISTNFWTNFACNHHLYTIINLTIQKVNWSSGSLSEQKSRPWMNMYWESTFLSLQHYTLN